jgi:hypothetical protein
VEVEASLVKTPSLNINIITINYNIAGVMLLVIIGELRVHTSTNEIVKCREHDFGWMGKIF